MRMKGDQIMTLKEWIYQERLTQDEFAKLVGVSRRTICSILGGIWMPSLSLALRIEERTNGEVTMRDLATKKETVT